MDFKSFSSTMSAHLPGDRAHLVIQLETLGAVDGDHLDGGDGVDALLQSPAENVVYVALGHQGVGVVVVGNQHRKPGVDVLLGDALSHFMEVPPSGALPEHGVHPQAHFCQGILCPGGFVAAADSRGDIGVEPGARFRQGVVAGNGFTGLERFAHNGMGALVGGEDAGEVHHLSQAHHAVPVHGFPDVLRAYGRPGVLKAGDGGYTGGGGDHGLQGGALGVFHHALYSLQAQHIADLMGIHKNTRGAVGDDSPGVLPHGDHGGFHVDMAVQEAGGDGGAVGVDDLGVLPDAVGGVPHQGDAAHGDGHIHVFL